MDDDKLEPTSAANPAESTSECGPGCNCGTTGIGTKGKAIICLVVAIAAAVVLAHSVMQKTETGVDQGQNAFAATVLKAEKSPSLVTAEKANGTDQTKSSLWGTPLESLASLDEVATQKDAVFVYLPIKGKGLDESTKKEIEVAAEKAQSRGTTMGLYTLDDGSKDYTEMTSQVSIPCVLAMVKGSGMSVVSGNISESDLLQGLVTASRPSGCSPGSSCGPSGCVVPTTKPNQI